MRQHNEFDGFLLQHQKDPYTSSSFRQLQYGEPASESHGQPAAGNQHANSASMPTMDGSSAARDMAGDQSCLSHRANTTDDDPNASGLGTPRSKQSLAEMCSALDFSDSSALAVIHMSGPGDDFNTTLVTQPATPRCDVTSTSVLTQPSPLNQGSIYDSAMHFSHESSALNASDMAAEGASFHHALATDARFTQAVDQHFTQAHGHAPASDVYVLHSPAPSSRRLPSVLSTTASASINREPFSSMSTGTFATASTFATTTTDVSNFNSAADLNSSPLKVPGRQPGPSSSGGRSPSPTAPASVGTSTGVCS